MEVCEEDSIVLLLLKLSAQSQAHSHRLVSQEHSPLTSHCNTSHCNTCSFFLDHCVYLIRKNHL